MSRGRICKENWKGWSPGWRRRELRSQSFANTSRQYVNNQYDPDVCFWICSTVQLITSVKNFWDLWKSCYCIVTRCRSPVSVVSADFFSLFCLDSVDVLCCLYRLHLHRSINWHRGNRVLRITPPKRWMGSSLLFLLLLRLSRKETKVGPLTTTCNFSERPRSSETALNKMTSTGKHEVFWHILQALILQLV